MTKQLDTIINSPENAGRRNLLAGALGLAAAAVVTSVLPVGIHASSVPSGSTQPKPVQFQGVQGESLVAHSSDGVTLYGDAQGDPGAPEILFIHGLRQSRMSWDKQFADPALAGFRLVRFDLRGHGDSDKPAAMDAYTKADLWADDLAAIIAAAKLRKPVVVGWSLGGQVAGNYLRKYGADRVAGLNLVSARTSASPSLMTETDAVLGGGAASHDLAVRTKATVEFLDACFYQRPPDGEFQPMLVVNGMTPRVASEGIISSGTELEPVYARYQGPVLLTHGAHDRLNRLAMSERIKAQNPQRRLSLFANSGHSPFYEESAKFNRELADLAIAANRVAPTLSKRTS